MKSYIMLNTKPKTATKNEFENDFFQVQEQLCFWKDHGKYQESQKHEASNKPKKITPKMGTCF